MVCNKVSKLLSEYFDGVLDTEASVQISQHLKQCQNCRKELDSLSALHDRLKSSAKIQAPDYLYNLVQMRLENKGKTTCHDRFKDAIALRWSRIRSTEFQFYWTRALGTVMAAFFFCVISSGIDPFYLEYVPPVSNPGIFSQEYRYSARLTISKNLGRFPIEQYKRNDQVHAAINEQYLDHIGTIGFKATDKEEFSVGIMVDRSGTAQIENGLEPTQDRDLLNSLNNVLESARCRPASMNGKTIASPLFLIFNQISVYE